MSETARKRCVFHGRVQGVGFRAFCRETASALGVQGWVRNRLDGAVEMEAESSPQVLAELIARLSGSHPPARVDRVDAMDLPSSGKEAGIFEVLY